MHQPITIQINKLLGNEAETPEFVTQAVNMSDKKTVTRKHQKN